MSGSIKESLRKLQQFSETISKSAIVKLGEVDIKLQSISAEDDAYITSWAHSRTRESRDTGFFGYYKLGVLSLAIIQLDQVSLKVGPEDLVETGEALPDGKAIKKTRFKLMNDLLKSLDPELIDMLFKKYLELAKLTLDDLEEKIDIPDQQFPPIREIEDKAAKLGIRKINNQDEVIGIPEVQDAHANLSRSGKAISEEHKEPDIQGVPDKTSENKQSDSDI